MIPEPPKPKKFINFILPYQKQDVKLQIEQNKLILKNTRWAVILGILSILAQIGEVISTIIFK
mgnify:CR=1 FL=1